MKSYLATAFICLFSLLCVPHTALAEAEIIHAPEEFFGACPNIVDNFEGSLVAYNVSKPRAQKKDPSIVHFRISGMNVDFSVKFLAELKASDRKRLTKEYGNLYAVFAKPGALAPTNSDDSVLDFLLVFHGYHQPTQQYICLQVTYANWLEAKGKPYMSKHLQHLIDLVAQPQGLIVPRDDTAYQMFTACSSDFIANNLAPTSVGYLVENGEVGIGTGRFYFAIEGGADGISYDVAEPQGTAAVSLLTSLANSTDHTKTALFAVFGQPLGKNGTVSVTLYAFDKYRPQKCVLLTPPENVFLRQEHLPPRVKQMLEEGWPEQAALQ